LVIALIVTAFARTIGIATFAAWPIFVKWAFLIKRVFTASSTLATWAAFTALSTFRLLAI
jgi:hypothetical protein